jgi:hypothetical protein
MRHWLGIGLVVVIVIAVVNVVTFVRRKQEDGRFRTAVTTYRSALKPGMSREMVEDYLRRQGMPFERSCCDPGVFSDRSKIGKEPGSWFCRNQNVYLEFNFAGSTPPADVARGSDLLTKIDLYQNDSCF